MAPGWQVGAGKTGAKSRDEEKRPQVNRILQRIRHDDDRGRSDPQRADKTVNHAFSAGKKEAREDFQQEHARKREEYKDRRYSDQSAM
jgi:hypothetical protein